MTIYKLKEIYKIKKGSHYPKTNKTEFWNGSYNWLKIDDIQDVISNSKIKLSLKGVNTVKNPEQHLFQKNTFVISCDGTIGKIGWLEKESYSSTHLINFKSEKIFLTKYLFYWFKLKTQYLKRISEGSVVPSISLKNIKNLKISLPEEKEIKKIIDIIEPVEKLFLKYYKCVRIDNFKNVQKDIKILIDIIEPMEKMENMIRDFKKNIMKLLSLNYYLSESKSNNYSPVMLEKLGDLKTGIGNLKKSKYDKGLFFVNYKDVFDNWYIDENTNLRHYDASSKEYQKYDLKYGDVLFTASSETPQDICQSSVFLSNKKAIFNGFCKRYRFNHSQLHPMYAVFLFRSKCFRKKISRLVTGYTRYNISQKSISSIELKLPTIEEQKQIINIFEILESLLNKIGLLKNKLKKLKEKIIHLLIK